MSKRPDYTIQIIEKKKKKPPTVFSILADGIFQGGLLATVILIAMRIVGSL